MLAFLRWFIPALVPAALLAFAVYRSDERREPVWLVTLTFVLGGVFGALALFAQVRTAALIDLDFRTASGAQEGSLLFLFAFIAPTREAAKVAAAWPAFRSRHFDEPYDGLVYAGAAALGFAALQNALVLHAHPHGFIWIARATLALPAHLFFACAWGYALGRAKQLKNPGAIFPTTWLVAVVGHGLYAHFVYGRGPGAIVAVVPLLLVMGVITWFAARDLRRRGDRPSRFSGDRLSRMSFDALPNAPTLQQVREALRRTDEPIKLRWILFGALVTVGTMIAGIAASVAFGNWAHVDFSLVDEHEVSTVAPAALLGAGLLAAFPVSGFLIARAARVRTLLEPALATAVAIAGTLLVVGLAARDAVVFAAAFSPVAWVLACAGAWVGRPAR